MFSPRYEDYALQYMWFRWPVELLLPRFENNICSHVFYNCDEVYLNNRLECLWCMKSQKKVQSNYDCCNRTTILWNGWLVVSSALISNTVYHDVIVFVGIKATVTYSYTVYDAYKYASMLSDVTMCCLRTNYITKGRLAFVWNA